MDIQQKNDDYLAAVNRGDTETAQRMVDEAAKRAGYDLELYHGSRKGGGFTVFKDWQYFTPNKAYAERYMERDNPDSLYHVYVKSERMFDTRRPECREIFEQMRMEYGLSEFQENGLPDWTDGYDISDFIEENGLDFDGVVLDESGDLTENGLVSRGVSYIIRNSEQVKSAEPVTYDEDENVIPISERFRTDRSGEEAWKNRDIRFSPAEEEDGVDWAGSEEDEGPPHPSASQTPSPQGEGSGGTGTSFASPSPTETTESGTGNPSPTDAAEDEEDADAVGLARDKKVALAEKATIDGLKSRIQSAEDRLRAQRSRKSSGGSRQTEPAPSAAANGSELPAEAVDQSFLQRQRIRASCRGNGSELSAEAKNQSFTLPSRMPR